MVVPNSWMVMVGKIPLKQMILGYPHLWQPPYPHYLTILMVKELNPIPGAGSEDPRISGKADVFNIGTSSISGYFYGMQST